MTSATPASTSAASASTPATAQAAPITPFVLCVIIYSTVRTSVPTSADAQLSHYTIDTLNIGNIDTHTVKALVCSLKQQLLPVTVNNKAHFTQKYIFLAANDIRTPRNNCLNSHFF